MPRKPRLLGSYNILGPIIGKKGPLRFNAYGFATRDKTGRIGLS
jgi:hypothetical protein